MPFFGEGVGPKMGTILYHSTPSPYTLTVLPYCMPSLSQNQKPGNLMTRHVCMYFEVYVMLIILHLNNSGTWDPHPSPLLVRFVLYSTVYRYIYIYIYAATLWPAIIQYYKPKSAKPTAVFQILALSDSPEPELALDYYLLLLIYRTIATAITYIVEYYTCVVLQMQSSML